MAKKAANKIKELKEYISFKQRILDGLNALSSGERKALAQARRELKQLLKTEKKELQKLYEVAFYNPDEKYPALATFENRSAAVKHIKEKSRDMLDTGDCLRKVKPHIYVLEPDYKNTGERATDTNYKHMYHWIIEEVG